MSRRLVIVGVLSVVLLFGGYFAVRRALHVMPYPIGTGETQKSPNGQYEASVTDWYDESYWGYSRQWFEFEVVGGTSKSLITDPISGPYFGSRSSHSVIHWKPDSSAVSFVFPSVEIRMKP